MAVIAQCPFPFLFILELYPLELRQEKTKKLEVIGGAFTLKSGSFSCWQSQSQETIWTMDGQHVYLPTSAYWGLEWYGNSSFNTSLQFLK